MTGQKSLFSWVERDFLLFFLFCSTKITCRILTLTYSLTSCTKACSLYIKLISFMDHDILPPPHLQPSIFKDLFPFLFCQERSPPLFSFQAQAHSLGQVFFSAKKLSNLVLNSLHSQGSENMSSHCWSFYPHLRPTKEYNELCTPLTSGTETLSLFVGITVQFHCTFSWTEMLLFCSPVHGMA